MSRLAVLLLIIAIVAGIALWLTVDPSARALATLLWNSVTAELARAGVQVDANSFLAPIMQALRDFADSVAGLLSPGRVVPISIPTIPAP